MPKQNQTQCSIEIPNNSIIDWIIGSVVDANATDPLPLSVAKIPIIPSMMSEKPDYEKYFAPQAVSIGPYHFGEPKLQMLEKRKPEFAMKLFSNDKEALTSLYEKLGDPEMVKDLRSFYEEGSTTKYCDKVFTKMMLLDGCFILYLINSVFDRNVRSTFPLHMVPILCMDLFLLENQIPFKVLSVAMRIYKKLIFYKFHRLINFMYMLGSSKPKRTWLESILCIQSDQRSGEQRRKSELIGGKEPDHLLHLLHRSHTPRNNCIDPFGDLNQIYNYKSNNFLNVNQLLDVGISFKPSDTISLENFDFSKGCCGFSMAVQLPPIDVTGYTKPILLNLIAYEMCSGENDWVTSYVCLLHSLISNHEDVNVLTKAGVLENWLGTDSEVVELFKEIATDLVPRNVKYIDLKDEIQRHYEVWSNTPISELRHEYRKSPWKFISLLGALIALFLTAVQTYFTVWSRK